MSASPACDTPVKPLTRRALLKMLLATWAGTCAVPWQLSLAASEPASGRQLPWLSRVTGQPDAVRRLGRAYLEAHAEENDLDRLLASVDQALAQSQGENSQPPRDTDQVVAELKRTVRDEYIRDQVIPLQGWVISRTEARLYALVAMV